MENLKNFVPPSSVSVHTESPGSIFYALQTYTQNIEESDLRRIQNSFDSLSEDDFSWLKSVHGKLGITQTLEEQVREGTTKNQLFLTDLFQHIASVTQADAYTYHSSAKGGDISIRVRLLPWQAAREWGLDSERNESANRVIEAVVSSLPRGSRILIPGSGCGRLLVDLASRGYEVVGIEFDVLKLLVFAHAVSGHKSDICPFVLETCNRMQAKNNVLPVTVPNTEVSPETLGRITLHGNEFFETSSGFDSGEFDGIVTCFFLDTMTDVEKYISEFSRIMKSGGTWVNCGPLNFHYPGERVTPQRPCRDISADDLVALVTKHGFEITNQGQIVTSYLCNPSSMMQTKLKCVFFESKLR